MVHPLFSYSKNIFPSHLSVGVVLMAPDNTVYTHVYPHPKSLKKNGVPESYDGDIVHLLRESIDEGETVEQAVHRGLLEEFGAQGEIKGYIGSLQTKFMKKGREYDKTTLYFLVEFTSIDEEKRQDDWEGESNITLMNVDKAIEKMKYQFEKTGLTNYNEVEILQRLKSY